ncbi:hypothetical protein USDA257_c09280 [Sinorhizobium fredii USDA 257]|uniref:Uncharacterized protein n=1 Tax=Sinorhizobium fredii (strain USDA 257) TaxID=1185652 RepID=I3X0W4_SINF2|nr:hypothetical protein USDA257_c09280 [Sinorhizobium fredii USDA 257]
MLSRSCEREPIGRRATKRIAATDAIAHLPHGSVAVIVIWPIRVSAYPGG